MRNLFLAAIAALGLSSAASAQYPTQPQQPVQPASGVNVIKGGAGCSNCAPAAPACGPTTRAFTMSKLKGGDNCGYGQACNNGCGSVKYDIAFQFGSCKDFFSPCGPRCPKVPFAQPFGTGWQCPRQYDSYANH